MGHINIQKNTTFLNVLTCIFPSVLPTFPHVGSYSKRLNTNCSAQDHMQKKSKPSVYKSPHHRDTLYMKTLASNTLLACHSLENMPSFSKIYKRYNTFQKQKRLSVIVATREGTVLDLTKLHFTILHCALQCFAYLHYTTLH